MTGHGWLQREFGFSPKVGWNLNNLAHTSTNALLFAELGYEAQFMARMDNNILDKFSKGQNNLFI